jgi:hypothetical protein
LLTSKAILLALKGNSAAREWRISVSVLPNGARFDFQFDAEKCRRCTFFFLLFGVPLLL